MAFIDQEKAFDRVARAELWKCLAERGIFGEVLRAVQSLYICSQAAVRTREGETDWLEVKCGLRQGCVLSRLLLTIPVRKSAVAAQRTMTLQYGRLLERHL